MDHCVNILSLGQGGPPASKPTDDYGNIVGVANVEKGGLITYSLWVRFGGNCVTITSFPVDRELDPDDYSAGQLDLHGCWLPTETYRLVGDEAIYDFPGGYGENRAYTQFGPYDAHFEHAARTAVEQFLTDQAAKPAIQVYIRGEKWYARLADDPDIFAEAPKRQEAIQNLLPGLAALDKKPNDFQLVNIIV